MNKLTVVIPKGRLNRKVVELLNEAGAGIEMEERRYIPKVKDNEISVKIMKPQNIPQLVEVGSHDIGFTGYDWIRETGSDVVELMDLEFDPVSIVSAIPQDANLQELKSRKIVVASEYESIARAWLDKNNFNYYFIRTFGATEVFPPDDADMIIDNMSSGRTLEEQKLKVVETILISSTRMIANAKVMDDPWKRSKVGEIRMLMQSVFDARNRVMLEMNIPADKYDAIMADLPCMRAPTVSPLYNNCGFAIKIAVHENDIAKLIPRLKSLGATDILEYSFRKVVL